MKLFLEMVIFDPKNDAEPIATHVIRFHTREGLDFMNRTAMWAWQNGHGVATKQIDELTALKQMGYA